MSVLKAIFLAFLVVALPSAAHASLALDRVIVDMASDQPARADIELTNEGEERMYVAVEPFEILHPDTEEQQRIELDLGSENTLFVSPRRLVLEPGEKRLVRIAAIGARPAIERTFRVRIRPVVGEVVGEDDGLKLLVGYDTLVLLRPDSLTGQLDVQRKGDAVWIRNNTNSSYEFFDGKACSERLPTCRELRPNRLYPGEVWEIAALPDEKIQFTRIVEGTAQRFEI
ncbi:hypothetical protein K3165_05940 [Qipengyuania sp. 1XM1-15A]|uniref:fimbrial biogenesis chaperone n=1 Tax=Qipengyuania xiamenensis TaxID=2867237 RepID=UPI001C8878C1|nr:hypothetical protein [Qipengyuania xiamenensis]MBX7532458.1 hypothetical protein [Qipengyuania xiamenensis]